MKLARQLLNLSKSETLGFAIGVVTVASPLTVRINGDSVDIADCPRAASYTPAVDDVVMVLRPGPAFLVLCKIA